MKVTDIINEDWKTTALSKVLGGAAELGAKVVGKSGKNLAVEKLAQHIADGGKVTSAKHLASIVGKEHATKDVLELAKKKAATISRNAAFTKNVANISGQASKAARITKGIISLGASTYYYALLWEPLSLYLDNINTAEEYLAAGQVPSGTPPGTSPQEWFDSYRQSQLSQLIGKWAVVWAGGKLVKMPFSKAASLIGSISPSLATGVNGLGRAGQLAMMSWLTSPSNSTAVAEFMASPLVAGTVGGVGATAVDTIKNVVGMASAKDTAPAIAAQGGQGGSDTPAGQPSNKPAAQQAADKVDPEEQKRQLALDNPANWEYSSPGMVKNKVTGDVDYVTNHR